MNHWLRKLVRFCRMPLFTKLHALSTQYYKLKGVIVYRIAFKQFGKGSYIRRPLLILNPSFISIGKRVGIRDGIRLEVIDRGGMIPSLMIGDNANIEQNVHIVCQSRISIGRDVSITSNCSIVDVEHRYHDVNAPQKIGARLHHDGSFVEIGDGSFLGIGVVVLPNVKIGRYCIVGANSVVSRDIPDFSVAAGVPAKVLKRYNAGRRAWEDVSTESVPVYL